MAKKVTAHPDIITLRKLAAGAEPHSLFTDPVLNYRVRELSGMIEAGGYPSDLIPTERAEKILGMSRVTIYRMVRAGKFRAFQIAGGPRRYSEAEVRSLVEDVSDVSADRPVGREFVAE
jgi:excisionase family DNA binding protein